MNSNITIRQLEMGDLTFADQVRALAGWNQTLCDWQRLLAYQPDGCFLALWNGQPAGTATAVHYGDRLGWIGMVLVHPDLRRRGIATALMQQCMEFLTPRVECIKLDATPDGQQVYERLGFQAEYALTRWQHLTWQPILEQHRCTPISQEDWRDIATLDTPVFGVDRTRWLQLLARDSDTVHVVRNSNGRLVGYGMARSGVRAAYLGPVVANTDAQAEAIVRTLLQHVTQDAVYWDVLDDNSAAVSVAARLGFTRQRPLLRMWHGTRPIIGMTARQWAIAGPSVG